MVEAFSYLRRAEKEPTMNLYYIIADKYVGRKKFVDAEGYYDKILKGDPDNKSGYADSALFSMGDMKARAKDYAGAAVVAGNFHKCRR